MDFQAVGGSADEDVGGAQPGEDDDEQREGVAPEPGEPLDGGAFCRKEGKSPPPPPILINLVKTITYVIILLV